MSGKHWENRRMPDREHSVSLAGKAKRVVGTFVLMVGAGLVLDSWAAWPGTVLMLIGIIVFVWGIVEAWAPGTVTRHEPENHAPTAATRPTENNL
jgi:hypothetical protein